MRTETEFDERTLVAKVARGCRDALKRAGAYIRRIAQRKVHISPESSVPGSAPNSRNGLLKRSILFGLDRSGDSVVVGPAESFVGISMTAHEYGGRYRQEHYPRRPLMGPSLREAAPQLPKLWENCVR